MTLFLEAAGAREKRNQRQAPDEAKTAPATPKIRVEVSPRCPPQRAFLRPHEALVGGVGTRVATTGNRIFGEEGATRVAFFFLCRRRECQGEEAPKTKNASLFLSFSLHQIILSLTSVAVEQRRVGAVEHGPARGDDKHGHARSVLRGDKDLRALEFGRRVKVALEDGLAEERGGLRRVQIHSARV